ncbi:replication initiation protein, partial [Campylobacter coli]
MQTPKKTNKKRIQKAVVTQNNRFVYAKYDMNTNELKMFMWIIAQLNSQKDALFQVCEMPLSQIFEVLNHQSEENYTYIKNLIDSMAKKTYIEDFKLLDEKTMKEVEIHRVMPLFQFIEYKKGASSINYRLNNSLMEYLLDQKRDFTQLKFNDIQQMKSAYSIRIYNMLICELK